VTPERWQQIEELFHAALPCAGRERAALLASAGDRDLRAEVERLLALHESSDNFMEPPTAGRTPTAVQPPLVEGRRVGSYRLVRVIASGGMGTVYEAVQDQPRRTVALKLMKRGLASHSALRRFEHESQILGRLRHPGIAQIYEAGTHTEGAETVPYFAMEFIEGVSLTDYADRHALGTRQRLELLAMICDAVHHGHQKGVIHRDLKPANLLVDSSGQPRVIDFGVARATDSDIQLTTLRTDLGQLIGTIPYMSPEQVTGDPADLDIRSDVYALGVVCYELLTGQLPYDVRNKPIPEAVRMIREQDPTPASTIDSLLRGDIQTILAKTLEKDRDRRYGSAHGLAADIRRYLHDEPITARPASTFYQLRKFSRRNKALVAGVAIAMVGLLLGTTGATWQALRATRARDDAEQAQRAEQAKAREASQQATKATTIHEFLETMLASADPRNAQGQEVTVRQVLDAAAERITDGAFEDQPAVEAAVRHTIGYTYGELGHLDQAEQHLEASLRIHRSALGNDHPDTLAVMDALAAIFRRQGRRDEAKQMHRDTLDARRRVLGNEDPATLSSMHNLAVVCKDRGELDEAEDLHRQALAVRRRVFGEEHPGTLASMNSLAVVLRHKGQGADAESLYEQTLASQRRLLGDEHPDTLNTMTNLANTLAYQRKFAQAETLLREALATEQRVLGEEHWQTLRATSSLAAVLRRRGNLDEAESLYRATSETQRRILGDEHPDTLQTMHNFAVLLQSRKKPDEAEPLHRQVWQTRREVLGPQHPHTLNSMRNLVWALKTQDKLTEAEELARRTLEMRQAALGPEHPDTLKSTSDLALILHDQRRYDEAAVLHQRLIEITSRRTPARPAKTAVHQRNYGDCLRRLGRYQEAETQLLAAYQAAQAVLGPQHNQTKDAARLLASLYEAWGKPDRAATYHSDPAAPAAPSGTK